MSQGLKPVYGWFVIVRAKARTYLRSNRKDKCNGKDKCNRKDNSNGKDRDPSLRSRMTS